jgi:hypothetical protein
VTANGAPLDSSVALVAMAKPITTEIVFETTLPTTGKRLEPDQPATGAVRLANVAPTEVTVAAGTIVATEDGVEFAFVEDVTVPAASDGNDGKGTSVGTLRAVLPGAGGNVETGTIGGQLPNGVYYTNRDAPTAGGTDREIAVVAEDDAEALLTQAEATLPDFVRQQLAQPLADGSLVLPATIAIGEGRNEFDHQPGDAADTVRLRVIREISAMAYQPEEVRARASEMFRAQLAAQAPAGYQLDVDAIALYPETIVEERAEGTRFRLVAEGRVLAVFDATAGQSLAAALAGADPQRAEAILRDVPQIERFEIVYAPAWFPDRMPGDADRIAIRLIE